MTGCSQKTNVEPEIKYITKTEYVYIDIPANLFLCENIDVNASNIKTQTDVSILLVDLTRAYEGCKSKVNSMRNIYIDYIKKQEN